MTPVQEKKLKESYDKAKGKYEGFKFSHLPKDFELACRRFKRAFNAFNASFHDPDSICPEKTFDFFFKLCEEWEYDFEEIWDFIEEGRTFAFDGIEPNEESIKVNGQFVVINERATYIPFVFKVDYHTAKASYVVLENDTSLQLTTLRFWAKHEDEIPESLWEISSLRK